MLWGKPLPRSFADRHVRLNKHEQFDDWWKTINEKLPETEALVEPLSSSKPKKQAALTYAYTGQRSFEVEYWKTIASLAEGQYLNKNVADCVRDAITERRLTYQGRQLDALGDHLLAYHRGMVAKRRCRKKSVSVNCPSAGSLNASFPGQARGFETSRRPVNGI